MGYFQNEDRQRFCPSIAVLYLSMELLEIHIHRSHRGAFWSYVPSSVDTALNLVDLGDLGSG